MRIQRGSGYPGAARPMSIFGPAYTHKFQRQTARPALRFPETGESAGRAARQSV